MNNNILKCDLHNYLEIACLYRIEVELILQNSDHHIGIPVTTRVNKEIGECLEFNSKTGVGNMSIPLLSLKTMQSDSPNSHFDKVVFNY